MQYVLVHGAWLGGWIWRRVLPQLHAAGHTTQVVTLTGVGERSHLLSASRQSRQPPRADSQCGRRSDRGINNTG